MSQAEDFRQQLRADIRDALRDHPETLSGFEECWARNDRYERMAEAFAELRQLDEELDASGSHTPEEQDHN
jgi:hypothetical protein